MSWDLRSEEFEAVVERPASERYAYLVKRCADWEEVRGLRDNQGWVTAEDDKGRMLMPIWPHADYTRACAMGSWEKAAPASIELDEWVEGWLSEFETRGHPSVFPVPSDHGVAADPERIRFDLKAELALYERSRLSVFSASTGFERHILHDRLLEARLGEAPRRGRPRRHPVGHLDGPGRQLTPRWPQDHAAVDPYRRPGY